jgi:hypothetical protein
MDIGEVLVGRDRDDIARTRTRAKHTRPAVVCFAVGCGLGAWCEAVTGLWSLALPTGLALCALALGLQAKQLAQAQIIHENSSLQHEGVRSSVS